ncbi:endopeptidase La [Chromatiales bacterium (ex Bugula neritina AB1)]|nr:endopeptidase La [Chromatiales bacterium (ex Bugula neritina AB1)]
MSSDNPHVIPKNNASKTGLILPGQALPGKLLILPVYERPFFPAQIQPLVVDKDHWQSTFNHLRETKQHIVGLIHVGDGADEIPGTHDFSATGCVVRMHNVVEQESSIQFIAQGLQRFTVKKWLRLNPPFAGSVAYPEEADEKREDVKSYAMALIQAIKELVPLNPLYNEELKNFLNHFNLNEPSPLADFAAAITTAPGEELQEVLDTIPILQRMEKVLLLLRKEIEMARLQGEIREEVESKIHKNQRDFFLKEQLKVIQRELGIAKDDRTADIEEFKKRMEARNPPKQVQTRFDDEIRKLSFLETGSPEYGVTRNYLDWVSVLPWGVQSEDKLNLKQARKILNRDHAGLSDVKDRILEFLALGAYRGEISGSILLLVGPPGVGKTSIGRSIADSLGRKFYRFSLGGMRDEAEIKGHRRTYIGAMPGKLIQALKEVEVENPVIMLDEVDKIGASFQGDPASALLEVLDPEQNSDFLDHYLDLRVDLSRVLFVCTANQMDTIPRPLLDRMDDIRLAGYLPDEKLEIANKHLWPRLLERNKVTKSKVALTDSAIKALIEGYAREAGVRNLEKLLAKILRKAVVKLLSGVTKVSINNKTLEEFVGPPLFRKERQLKGIGIVTGLAWTAMGGATLPIEASIINDQKSGFKLTGNLGDVMKESAEIAYSYITSRLGDYSIKRNLTDKAFIHLHVPEGATPKDGPSAGITMATALLSLALNKKISPTIAMTGELTLTGQVLPVGGIKEKLIASKRLGIKTVILPIDNKRDFDELPKAITTGLKVHFAESFSDVSQIVFKDS